MTFTRRIENFTCEHCAEKVAGDGYTNHCPRCLWSKHVDVSPGDRAEVCRGIMRPVALEGGTPKYDIVHECLVCGTRRRIKSAARDDAGALVALVVESSQRL